MDGVHEDHMDMDVQVFMDERMRLARGSHGWHTWESHGRGCTGFHRLACKVSTWFPWMYMYEVSMDGVREIQGWCVTRRKRTHRQRETRRTCSWPKERGLEAQKKAITHTHEWKSHMEFSKGVISKLVSYQDGDLLVGGLFCATIFERFVGGNEFNLAITWMLDVMEKIPTMRM